MANNGAYIVIDGEKQFISRELRFLHHTNNGHPMTREDAKNYVDQSLADGNINSDYAQPIVVAYEDENGFSQIILGIGLGESEGYHFIDSHALEHDVKALIASIGTGDEGADLVYDDKKLLSVKDQIATINQTIQNGDPEEIVSFDPEHTIAAKISEILNYIENATASIGLNADGTLGEFTSTEYIADGQSLKEAVETLDESLADVQRQVTSNKISSADHSIVVNQEPDGTDISVNLDGKTIVLDDEGTVLSGLWIKKYDEGDNIGSNLLAVYKLVDVDGNPIEGSRDIEIPKDRALFSAALGDMGDEFNRPYEGDVHKTLFPDDIKSGTLEEEALRFIYELADGVFQMVLINIEEFLQEAEFKDGLEVNNHEVSVKLDKTPGSDSERFLDFVEVPGENAAVGLHGITDAIQVETDRAIAQEDKIEASVGLAEDGSHIETEGHYTSGASTIAEEIAKLDAEAFRNSGETDAIEVGVGLNEDGEYIKTEDRFTSGATSITEAIKALNDQASDNQDELDNVETNIGLDDNGNYVPYEDGSYTSGATTVLEATSKLDDAVKDLQEQITANKIYGEDAIKVRREDSGTTVSVKIGDDDKLLTNDEDGLHTTIDLVEVEGEELAALGSNVKEAYKLTGVGDAQIGQYIKIYRDSVIYRIAIGDMGDKFTNFEPDSECMITTNPKEENITHGTTGKEAIRIIYDMGIVNEEGKELYQMVLVDVDEFLQLNEFKDGLEVVQGETSKVVKVKIDEESEGFLTVSIDGVKLSGVQDAINFERDRAIAEENRIETSVGLDADGNYVPYENGTYTQNATTTLEATSNLDDALKDVQEQVTANKVYGEDAIKVNTVASGTTVSLKLLEDGILTNENDGLHATLAVKSLTPEEISILSDASNVREAYKLVGKDGVSAYGDIIKIYKDSTLYSVVIGDMGDYFNDGWGGDPYLTQFPYDDNIIQGETGKEALRLIYHLENGLYRMTLIDLESFVQESEFKDGLVVKDNEVSVKLDTTPGSDSERFLDFVEISGENAAVGLHGITDAIQVETDRATAQEDVIEANVGLAADGTHITTTGHYTSSATTIASEIAALDAEAFRNSGETDAIETAVGLDEDGNYIPKTHTNHLDNARSVEEEILALDSAIGGGSSISENIIAGVGLNSDGTYKDKTGTGYLDEASSVEQEIAALDAEAVRSSGETNSIETAVGLDANGNYIQKEDTHYLDEAESIEGEIATLDAEAFRNSGETDNIETAVGLNADGTHKTTTGKYTSEATTIAGEIAALDAEAFRHSGETDSIETAVGLDENGRYVKTHTKFTSAQTSVYNSIEALDTQAEINQDETNRIETGVGLDADGNYIVTSDAITSGANSIAGAIKALNDHAVGKENELDTVESSVGLAADGTHIITNGHYTSAATTVTGEIAALDAEAFRHSGETDAIEGAVGLNSDGTHKTTTGHYTSSATTLAGEIAALDSEAYRHSGETDAIETAVGLNDNGTYVKTATRYTSAQTSVYNAVQALDTQAASSQDELDRAESALGLKSDGTYERTNDRFTSGATTMAGAIKGLNDQASANQDETDTIEVGVGLNNDGTYIRKTGTAYLNDATSVEGEIAALDREASRHSGETDSIETSVGLNTDGTYSKPAGVYVSGSTSVKDALEKLNDQAVSNQNETNTVEDGVGLNADGSHIRTNGHYTSTATTIAGEIAALDDEAYRHSGETDSIETAVGLNVDGSYIQPSSSQFISASTNVMSAVRMLNEQAVSNQGETDTIESAVGLNSDGTHVTTRGNYTSGASTIAGEIAALDTEAYRNASEHGAIRTAVGLDQNGNYIPTTDRFTSAATSVMGAITLAVRQIDANETNISTFGSDILKNKVHSGSNAITVEETGTEESGTKVGLWINSADNVLTQDNGLLATIHLTKATGITTGGTAYNCIRLIGRNNIILDEINTDDFVKDGFLDNVEIVTRSGKNYLVFTWNTDSGKLTTEIDATELVRPYTASSGVTLDNNTNNLSGVVDPTSDPYFTLGADGFKLSGVKNAVDTINNLLSGLRSEFDVERLRSQNKDAEQDDRLNNNEHDIQDNTDRIQDLQEQIDQIGILGDGVRDIYTDNGGIEIRNTDVSGEKYRNLKLKLGSTPDDREELPEVNYLRIVTEKDPSTGAYTAFSGLHTTIRPISETEINEIMNLTNIQA